MHPKSPTVPLGLAAGAAEPLDCTHAHKVLALLRSAAKRAAQMGWATWTTEELTYGRIYLHAECGELFGWLRNAEILGCCVLQEQDSIHWPDAKSGQALYLHKLAVKPCAAGEGIGVALIQFACRLARIRRLRMVRLDTIPESPLVAYYERQGFQVDASGPANFGGRWLIRMERCVEVGAELAGQSIKVGLSVASQTQGDEV
jgi:ribosomal protein S18 acetylase RimI-like enzyme